MQDRALWFQLPPNRIPEVRVPLSAWRFKRVHVRRVERVVFRLVNHVFL
jgi:hypothetical protein